MAAHRQHFRQRDAIWTPRTQNAEMRNVPAYAALGCAHRPLTCGAIRSRRIFPQLRSLLRDRRGSIAVEFAILLPVQALLIFGGIDLVFAALTEERLSFATEAAARCGALNGSQCETAEATSTWAAHQSVGVPNISAENFVVTFDAQCGGVSVVATYSYSGIVLPAVTLGSAACYIPEQKS